LAPKRWKIEANSAPLRRLGRRNLAWATAHGQDDAALRAQGLALALALHFDLLPAAQETTTAHGLDLVLLEEELDALGILADGIGLGLHHARKIDARRAHHHAHLVGMFQLTEEIGGMEE